MELRLKDVPVANYKYLIDRHIRAKLSMSSQYCYNTEEGMSFILGGSVRDVEQLFYNAKKGAAWKG